METRVFLAAMCLALMAGAASAYELSGTVADLEGKPLKGAEVIVSWNEFDYRRFAEKSQKTKSDDSGAFHLSLVDQKDSRSSSSRKGNLALIIFDATHYAEVFVDPRYDAKSETYTVHAVAVKRQDRTVRLISERGAPLKDEAVFFVPSATADGASTRQFLMRTGRTDAEGRLRYEYMEGEHVLAVYAGRDEQWWNTSVETAKWGKRGRFKNPDGTKVSDVIVYDVSGTMEQPAPKDYSGRVFTFSTPMDAEIQTIAAFDAKNQCVFQDRLDGESGRYARVVCWLNPNPGAKWDKESDRAKYETSFTRVALPDTATGVLLTRGGSKETGRGSSRITTSGYAWLALPKLGGQPIAVEFKELSSLPFARMRMAEMEKEPVTASCSTSLQVLFNGANIDLFWCEADENGVFLIPILPPAKEVAVQTWGGGASSELPFNDLPLVRGMVADKDYTLFYHSTVNAKVRLVDANGKELRGYSLNYAVKANDASSAQGWMTNSGTTTNVKAMRAGAECEVFYLNQRIKFKAPTETDTEVVIKIAIER